MSTAVRWMVEKVRGITRYPSSKKIKRFSEGLIQKEQNSRRHNPKYHTMMKKLGTIENDKMKNIS
jgi:hypothetical protein